MWKLCYRFFSSVFSFCKTKGYYYWKDNFCTLCIQIPASGLLQIGQKIRKMTMASQFSNMTSTSNFFDAALFLLSSLVTGPSFISTSSLVLELWQFSYIRDWPEIWKSEIPLSEFYPISGDWGELWIPNLAHMSLIECHWMLHNSRVTAFTVFESLKENQLGEVAIPEVQSVSVLMLWLITLLSSFRTSYITFLKNKF